MGAGEAECLAEGAAHRQLGERDGGRICQVRGIREMDSRDDQDPPLDDDDIKRGVFRTREAGFLKSS